MSLKEQDRATLVVLGLEKSDKMLEAANWLIEEERWSLAANRLYYALFHAVKALLNSEAHLQARIAEPSIFSISIMSRPAPSQWRKTKYMLVCSSCATRATTTALSTWIRRTSRTLSSRPAHSLRR